MSADLVRARIDEGPVVPLMWLVVLLGFLLNLADGIDVVAMSVTAPSVAASWGLERAALGPLFSAALFGMAIGAAGLAPLSDQLGRRLLLVAAMFLVGLSMLAVSWIATTASVTVFAILRFISGLGIGVIFGSAPALASEFMPSRYRSLAVSLVVMGYPVGAVLAGPIANALIPDYGWTAVFTAGGILTLLIGIVTWALLPESPEFLASRAGNRPEREAAVNGLLARLEPGGRDWHECHCHEAQRDARCADFDRRAASQNAGALGHLLHGLPHHVLHAVVDTDIVCGRRLYPCAGH